MYVVPLKVACKKGVSGFTQATGPALSWKRMWSGYLELGLPEGARSMDIAVWQGCVRLIGRSISFSFSQLHEFVGRCLVSGQLYHMVASWDAGTTLAAYVTKAYMFLHVHWAGLAHILLYTVIKPLEVLE